MSTTGKVKHNDAICSIPLNEHIGTEPCLMWVEPPEPEVIPTRRYTVGPQGNQVIDHGAEWEDTQKLHGSHDKGGAIGHPEIEDRRDNRDPEAVGRALLAERNGG